MKSTLKLAFQIDYNYKINAFLYSLKKIPIIGKYIPSDLYRKEDIKRIIRIFYILFSIGCELTKKFIYIGFFFVFLFHRYINTDIFIMVFMLFALFGAIVNAEILAPRSKNYYAVILMGMDAKVYALSHFLFYLGKTLLFFTPPLLFFLWISNIALLWSIPLLFFLCTVKIIGEYICLQAYLKKGKLLRESGSISVIGGIIVVVLAFLLCQLTVLHMGPILLCTSIFTAFFACRRGRYLWAYSNYQILYKEIITLNKIFFDTDVMVNRTKKEQVKIIDRDIEISEKVRTKTGYSYFNAIFFRRHQRILLRSAWNCTAISFLIAVGIGLFMYIDPSVKVHINSMIMTWFPYFVFIMYLINRGAVITQAMFVNCDNSMLAYNFYKDPKTILNVFKTRLKTVVGINVIPAIIIALSLPVLLYISGGTSEPLVYISLFLSIIFMSVFFSVHHLVLYYILQPYDINMKARSSTYNIAQSITYIGCYLCIKLHVDTGVFSVGVISLTGIYIVASLFIAYKYAPKTFRLK